VNYAFARNQYKKSNNAALSALSDPHEMIGLTMKELSRSLSALQNVGIGGDRRKNYLSKAFTAIYILQTSLDFEKGQDIANNLFKLYEYIRIQLQKTMKNDVSATLQVCSEILQEIIDAWDNIK
jgi:flagellar protein FliS|tara:strand:+ start:609 stop:980 length:372 start_codon:yes stop_codon:yes gene_type:complete